MKTIIFIISLFAIFLSYTGAQSDNDGYISDQLKPRIIVLTDISPNDVEPDDMESLIRLLAHVDLFEIEGLIATTGYSSGGNNANWVNLIHNAIDAYEKDLPNLQKRSNQTNFEKDETMQKIGYWPSPTYLRSRTAVGSQTRGIEFIGKGNNSPGSRLIIETVGEEDDRPVWVLAWGGGNTLAQAVWQVQQKRKNQEFLSFLNKLRIYTITDQDATNIFAIPEEEREEKLGKILANSSHQWLRREFEQELMFLWDECAWKFQNGTGKNNWNQYVSHIQGHGHMGDVYPKYKYGVEGDTPSFLYLLPNGLNNPEVPGQISWGGYFEWRTGPDNITKAYNNHTGDAYDICSKYFLYFYPAAFNNFAARMDWADKGHGNRNPVVIVNGDASLDAITLKTKPGKKVKLDASASFDPDGDQLQFKWYVLPAAGTYAGSVLVSENNTSRAKIKIPLDSAGKTIHIICEVTDNGNHNLTSYRRIVIEPAE